MTPCVKLASPKKEGKFLSDVGDRILCVRLASPAQGSKLWSKVYNLKSKVNSVQFKFLRHFVSGLLL